MSRVIKVGSTSLFEGEPQDGVFVEIARGVNRYAEQEEGATQIVSSGAVAFGRAALGLKADAEETTSDKQVLAAVGQRHLMNRWAEAFEGFGMLVGQVLVTNEVLSGSSEDAGSHLRNTLKGNTEKGIVSIINENDAVAVDEIVQGDNDNLSALVANMVDARELYILGTASAVYQDYPENRNRIRSATLAEIDVLRSVSTDTDDPQATGGMSTKLDAAEIFLRPDESAGRSMFISSAENLHQYVDPFRVIKEGHIGTRLTHE